MITIDLDSKSWQVIDALSNFHSSWQKHMYEDLPKELAKKAEEHFKPMLAVRPNHTEELERSIRYEPRRTSDGWEVDYYGLYYGIFIDIGNFNEEIVKQKGKSYPLKAEEYGIKAFPIDKRLGTPIFSRHIHEMGSYTPGVPTHYSEKTVEWLANGAALEVAYEHVMAFLSEVIR